MRNGRTEDDLRMVNKLVNKVTPAAIPKALRIPRAAIQLSGAS